MEPHHLQNRGQESRQRPPRESALGTSGYANHHGERHVSTELFAQIGVSHEEIALLRAFLGEEIDRILFGEPEAE